MNSTSSGTWQQRYTFPGNKALLFLKNYIFSRNIFMQSILFFSVKSCFSQKPVISFQYFNQHFSFIHNLLIVETWTWNYLAMYILKLVCLFQWGHHLNRESVLIQYRNTKEAFHHDIIKIQNETYKDVARKERFLKVQTLQRNSTNWRGNFLQV